MISRGQKKTYIDKLLTLYNDEAFVLFYLYSICSGQFILNIVIWAFRYISPNKQLCTGSKSAGMFLQMHNRPSVGQLPHLHSVYK